MVNVKKMEKFGAVMLPRDTNGMTNHIGSNETALVQHCLQFINSNVSVVKLNSTVELQWFEH